MNRRRLLSRSWGSWGSWSRPCAAVAAGVVALTLTVVVPVAHAVGPTAIAYGDTVSPGNPVAGAGDIEDPGDVDTYEFDANAGDGVVLDVLSGNNTLVRWRLIDPLGATLFDGLYVDRAVPVVESGTYSLSVRGASPNATAPYSFRLLIAPPPESFDITIGQVVAHGDPAPGAGNLEVPGAVDEYRFEGVAGSEAVFDILAGLNVFVGWQLLAPDGSEVFASFIGDRAVTLPSTGTYTLRLHGNGVDDVGTYSFQILGTPAAQTFPLTLDQVIADGAPPGAGNLEVPGATDRYSITIVQPQSVIFDTLSGSTVGLFWKLVDPNGDVVFDSQFTDRQELLTDTGDYELVVSGITPTVTGEYSFVLYGAPAEVDEFVIAIGDTVHDGSPGAGAGNLEVPGALDRYLFDAAAGQLVDFNVLAGDIDDVRWSLEAPDGNVVFDDFLVEQRHRMPLDGTYALELRGVNLVSSGTYSFRVVEAPTNQPPSVAPIDDMSSTEGDVVAFDVVASDPDGDPLQFVARGLPPGVVIDPGDGTLSGTVASGAAAGSPYSVQIGVSDTTSIAVAAFTWTVSEPDPPEAVPIDVDIEVVPCVGYPGQRHVAVVVFGNDDVDVRAIDARSIEFEWVRPDEGTLATMSIAYVFGIPVAVRIDVDRDGRKDLVVVIDMAEMPARSVDGTIKAMLRDGTRIAGTTPMCVIHPHMQAGLRPAGPRRSGGASTT